MFTKRMCMLTSYLWILFNFLGCSSSDKSIDSPTPSSKIYSSVLKVDENIQSNMVIQQNASIVISGEGTANQWVKIVCSWDHAKEIEVQVSDNGKWSTTLKTGNGNFDIHSIQLIGKSKIEYNDILIGEVWLCSGQSNMWWPMKDALGGLQELIKATDEKHIRILNITQNHSNTPIDKLTSKWQKTSNSSLEWFSAVGYFFAKQLKESLNVPIGIINASWGDTTAEVWAERNSVLNKASIKEFAIQQDNTPRSDAKAPYKIGSAFNGMIYPLRNIPIKGAIWYQGEANMDNPNYYPELMNTLVGSWRSLWKANNENFPFYIAQICPYKRDWSFKTYYANPNMRFAQQKASLLIPNSGVICNDDLADINDIHPRNKKDVGYRFAHLALNQTYSKSESLRSPIYNKMSINGNKLIVEFKYAESGLKTNDGQTINMFEIAGADRIFYPAQAIIENNTVILTSNYVAAPTAARLGWSYTKTTNLVHKSGLPVSVFKTYDWAESAEEL